MSQARFRLVRVGRAKASWADPPVEDWGRRMRRWGGFAEEEVRPEPFRGDVGSVRDAEAARILEKVGERARLVTLDERGERLDTEAFASLVGGLRQQGAVVFALGGPYGHGERARTEAARVVRLSDLVLNHELARAVLVEQLYRALTLLEGVPYHH
jgi:23S rRNA (pseudouridine1915-N3)-methyltransferase